MPASLADQAGAAADLAIALGANLPSPAGEPLATLRAVRPELESLVRRLGEPVCWSPLFRTAPVGGPAGQPHYLNAVLLVRRTCPPELTAAQQLLVGLQRLELQYGRQRREHWGPRSLDLDLLWWGRLCCDRKALTLPHPRLQERSFVLAPLAAIHAGLKPPGSALSVAATLELLLHDASAPAPEQLPGCAGWPE